MDWTLHEIELKNFKFFYDSFPFPMDGSTFCCMVRMGRGKVQLYGGYHGASGQSQATS